MFRNKRILALMAGILSVTLLGGCSLSASGTKGGKDLSAETENSVPKGAANPPKGRYMEEEILFPEEIRNMTQCGRVQREDGTIAFYFESSEGIAVYSYDGKEFKKQDTPAPGPEGIKMTQVFIGQDGVTYYGGFDKEYIFHLWSLDAAGQAQELFSEVFKAKEGMDYGQIPDYIQILENGDLLLSLYSGAGVYSQDGKQRFAIAQDYMWGGYRSSAFLADNNYLTVSNEKIVRYDITTGQPSGEFEIPEKNTTDYSEMTLFSDGEGGIYASCRSGLYHTTENGTIWEQIIDGTLNYMSRPDFYAYQFYKMQDGSFTGLYQSGSSEQLMLFKYTFDETVAAVPPEILTVYALKENPTVRQAAAVMQKNNPQVRVELRIALGEDEKVTEDVVRALNTELLNKKGADVLILDGLPAKSYQRKGILADLGPALQSVRGEILPGVLDDYESNGQIYYLPARITMPVVSGSEEAKDALLSFDKMSTYEGTPPLLSPSLYEDVLRNAARLNYSQLFNEDGSITDENLRRYLTSVKAAGDRGSVKVSFTEEDIERLDIVNRGVTGRWNADYAKNKCASGTENLRSVEDSMFALVTAKQKNTEIESANETYIPAAMIGINASSQNQKLAEMFVNILFEKDVQDASLSDGFPVRSTSLDSWVDTEKSYIVSYSENNSDFEIEAEWPVKKDRELIINLVKNLETPAVVDETIMQIIIDGSKDYLSDKETVEGAIQTIGNKIGLYMAEKE